MWGNLADRLGAKDINSTLQKIGNAVAPPPGDYDDDYDDEYDDEYDQEEYGDEQFTSYQPRPRGAEKELDYGQHQLGLAQAPRQPMAATQQP